jgi:O-succinylbenzoic acid--CoA ligase
MSVTDVLRASAGASDAPAVVDGEKVWSYAELSRSVDARATGLRAEGVRPGSVVPIVLEPDGAGIIELLALWRLGATPAPLNAKLTAPELETARRSLAGASAGAQAILWTSGTAGRARGVAIPFEAMRASTTAAARRLDLRASDVWLASLSPAHVGGLVLIVRSLLLGGALVVVGAFDAARALDAMHGAAGGRVRVTHASFVPTQLLRILDAARDAPPPSSFRCALIGGAETPHGLLARAHAAAWPVALTYGLSETTSQVATAPPELARAKPGTVGKPLDGVEVRVTSDGEILVRGATMASTYVGEDVGALTDADGWHHTGDVGRVDADGDLWVSGRRVDRIVSGGVTIDAVEVEEALRAHAQVEDACVVGVPNPEWGEVVSAWVEPAQGSLDLDGVDTFVRGRLAGSKVPRVYHVGGPLPRNTNGKLDRGAVRAALMQLSGDPHTK